MRIFKKKNSSIKGEFMGRYPSCGIKPRLWNRIRYEVEIYQQNDLFYSSLRLE